MKAIIKKKSGRLCQSTFVAPDTNPDKLNWIVLSLQTNHDDSIPETFYSENASLKNRHCCQCKLLSHIMHCCFCFVMLSMIMNSYVTFWTSTGLYNKFITRDYATEVFYISEFHSVWQFTEQLLNLVGHEKGLQFHANPTRNI